MNKKVIWSHELPEDLLEEGLIWNDYDYALPKYLEESSKYLNYFKEARKKERFIILDNGLFEGDIPGMGTLLNQINYIQPDIFILPDVWNDSYQTLKNAEKWVMLYSNQVSSRTKFMVVFQARNINQIEEMYNICKDMGINHFAYNHSSVLYDNICFHPHPDVRKCLGRVEVIHKTSSLFNKDDYVHLLGASLPQEFIYYNFGDNGIIPHIKSIDTSNPVILGLNNKEYSIFGENKKIKDKLEKYFYQSVTEEQRRLIFKNIKSIQQEYK